MILQKVVTEESGRIAETDCTDVGYHGFII